MNEQTPTQQPENSKFAKARRFTGRHRTLVIAGAAGLLVLGGGTAAAFAADLDDRFEGDASTGGTGSSPDLDDKYDADDNGSGDDDFALPAEAVDQDAAVEAALAEVDGTVTDADLEGTAEAPVWIVEITKADGAEWDVAVDALAGTVLDSAEDVDDDNDGDDDLDDQYDNDDRDDDDDNDGDDD
ncbi:Peptidase propeptide and YPEB domain-containing protein [Glycomyces sambucus]|uniref:Peptidase propeptide and YPEB domain-containing protein n=1 Tax=Glycomyces sambucus TaxID=380244 RepID=A0A1G9LGJ2_9ACTN|nr:PepSY domain-containing protein [Glycomyces sambucus]SDL60917.1 Peptidase propeptide and YPEB domain-containing protein [Glycomyces sambucus]